MTRPARLLVPLSLGCVPVAKVDSSDPPLGEADTGGPGQRAAAVITQAMDYATGAFATVDLDTWAVDDGLFPVAGDAAVQVDGDRVHQLNRLGTDTLRAYRAGDWGAPLWEVSTGSRTNPHDARVCGGGLYLSLYEENELLVIDPDSGARRGSVDLSAQDDGDGVEASDLLVLDGTLYVGLQRMARTGATWTPNGGRVLAVDCATGLAGQAWPAGANTRLHGAWEERPLASGGAWGELPAGIYTIDPAAGRSRALIDMSGTGHAVIDVAVAGDHALIVTLADDLSGSSVWCADLRAGRLEELERTTSYLTSASANDRGEAWVTAHWGWVDPELSEAGLLIYDIEGCARLNPGAPVRTALGPVALAFY
jgi:hypothetical protein